MIVTEALSLVGGDGAAVLKAREAVWRVVVHDQRDAPAADRLGTALLDACEQGRSTTSVGRRLRSRRPRGNRLLAHLAGL